MTLNVLNAISPIDGRYGNKTTPLRTIFSEYGLISARVLVEVRWLQALAELPQIAELPALNPTAKNALEDIVNQFSEDDAAAIKAIERTTNHDVKAVEYFLKSNCTFLDKIGTCRFKIQKTRL